MHNCNLFNKSGWIPYSTGTNDQKYLAHSYFINLFLNVIYYSFEVSSLRIGPAPHLKLIVVVYVAKKSVIHFHKL